MEAETCWSIDGERFHYRELGDVLDDLLCDYEESQLLGMKIYKAEATQADTVDLVTAEDVLEMLGERAYDEFGECDEDYPGPSERAKERLSKYLRNWVKKECPVSFWHVRNVEEYIIAKEDLGLC